MAPEKLRLTESSELSMKIDTGLNIDHQTEGPEQVNIADLVAAAEPAKTAESVKTAEPVQSAEPVKTANPVQTTEPVEAVEPIQTTGPVPTAPKTACTTEVSHIEEEKQEEHIPQSPPRSPGSPQVNGSIVNKLFSAFRPTTEENPQATPEYVLQL